MLERLRTARAAGGYERWERRSDRPLLLLAAVYTAVLVLPLLIHLTSNEHVALGGVDFAIWFAFAVDYGARLYLAPARWRFVRTHALDLLVVAVPLVRPLRALRFLRLARLGALIGVTGERAERSLHVRVATYVIASVLALLLVAAFAMQTAEGAAKGRNIRGFGDALWWAATTVTTVGYGDRYPTTLAGRLVAVTLMIAGIALASVVTATIAGWFVERLGRVQAAARTTEATLADVLDELREVRERLEAIERQTAGPR